MVTRSIPKLMQEAGKVKEALEKIGAGLPAGISAAEMAAKIAALEKAVKKLDALNVEKTQLVNSKAEQAQALSDYIVQVHLAVKAIYGPDSSEYEMAGGTRASERRGRRVRESQAQACAERAAALTAASVSLLSSSSRMMYGGIR